MRFATAIALTLFSLGLTWAAPGEANPQGAPQEVVAFMCADSGAVSGAHELGFIHKSMINATMVSLSYCQSAYVGYLRNGAGSFFPAVAVTTGIGYASAATCSRSLYRSPLFRITSVVFIGTSGFSPLVGGFNPTVERGCEPLQPNVVKNAVGSVCVTSGGFLQECAYCTETLSSTQCDRPLCFGRDKSRIRNAYVMDGSLAEKIRAASLNKPFPAVPPIVAAGMAKWWAANEAVTDHATPTRPHLVRCAESTINSIFVGAQRDYLCREFTAQIMNLSLDEAVCVQAMEAFGFLRVAAGYPSIPIAIIRTASNYDMYPLKQREGGRWVQDTSYVSTAEYDEFVIASFHYSIETAMFVVSNYFLA